MGAQPGRRMAFTELLRHTEQVICFTSLHPAVRGEALSQVRKQAPGLKASSEAHHETMSPRGFRPRFVRPQSLVFESRVSAPHLWTVSSLRDLTPLPRLVPSRAHAEQRFRKLTSVQCQDATVNKTKPSPGGSHAGGEAESGKSEAKEDQLTWSLMTTLRAGAAVLSLLGMREVSSPWPPSQ